MTITSRYERQCLFIDAPVPTVILICGIEFFFLDTDIGASVHDVRM